MIKVIHLIPTLTTGGAETMVKDYCLLFDKTKIDVHVVVIGYRTDSSNEMILAENGIRVSYLSEMLYGNQEQLNLIKRYIRKLSRYYFWRAIVLEEQPDIIHMHLQVGKYMKCISVHRLQCSLIMTVHNVIDNFFSKSIKAKKKYKEYKEVQRLVNRYDMNLIALHEKLAEELKEYFQTNRVFTIKNGVVLNRFDRKIYDRKSIRKSLGIAEDEYLIGNVASLTPQKNHKLILSVFEMVLRRNSKAKLLLVGQGSQKSWIEDYIKKSQITDKVILLSNRGDIPELMCAMDVFFFPSKWEGFGNVMIEAQSMGLRCVVSNAVPDCTRVTDNVVVCNLDDDIDVWVNAVLGDDSKLQPRVAKIDDYDMKNCVARLEEYYTGILNRENGITYEV